MPKPTILHLITTLRVGGAEAMLAKLIESRDAERFDHHVVCLTDGDEPARRIASAGVPVHTLGLISAPTSMTRLATLARIVRATRPTVIQTWLYHADLAGTLLRSLAPRAKLAWNVRCAEVQPGPYSPSMRVLLRTLAATSRWPDAIVVNSDAGRRLHEERLGYRARRWVYLPNGIDSTAFRPDAEARAAFRREQRIADDDLLIGLVARFDPLKDHRTFLRAAAAVERTRARFVLVGSGTGPENGSLTEIIRSLGLEEHVVRLGLRKDVARIMAALDVLVLSSMSEGFPNVLIEGMASALPCVSTDVGDAATILGDTGRTVPARDPGALAEAIRSLLEADASARRALGRRARERVIEKFDLPAVTGRYESFWEELARS